MEKVKHPSLVRLMEAAHAKGIRRPTELADAMDETPMVIANWGRRGVSRSGADKAKDVFGVSPRWVLHGTEPQLADEAQEQLQVPGIPPLSRHAIELAVTLDEITDRGVRLQAYIAATQVILQYQQQLGVPPIALRDPETGKLP